MLTDKDFKGILKIRALLTEMGPVKCKEIGIIEDVMELYSLSEDQVETGLRPWSRQELDYFTANFHRG